MSLRLIAVFALISLSFAFAQDELCFTCEGTKLIYRVTAGASNYAFIVSPEALGGGGIAFNWLMSTPGSGRVEMTAQALQSSMIMHNFFQDGSDLKLEDAVSVLLSKDAYRRVAGLNEITLDTGIGEKTFSFSQPDMDFIGFVDPNLYSGRLPALQEIKSEDDSFIRTLQNFDLPLITHMKLEGTNGFEVKLELVTR